MRDPFSLPSGCSNVSIDVPVSGFIPTGFPICSIPDLTRPTLVIRAPRFPLIPLNPPDACQCFTVDLKATVYTRKPLCPPATFPGGNFFTLITLPGVTQCTMIDVLTSDLFNPGGHYVKRRVCGPTPVTKRVYTIGSGFRPTACTSAIVRHFEIPYFRNDVTKFHTIDMTVPEDAQVLRFTARMIRGEDCCDPSVKMQFDMDVPCIPFQVTSDMRINGFTAPGHFRAQAGPETCNISFGLDIPCMPFNFSSPDFSGTGAIIMTGTKPMLNMTFTRQTGTCAYKLSIPQFDIPCMPLTINKPTAISWPRTGNLTRIDNPILDVQVSMDPSKCEMVLDIPQFDIPCVPFSVNATKGTLPDCRGSNDVELGYNLAVIKRFDYGLTATSDIPMDQTGPEGVSGTEFMCITLDAFRADFDLTLTAPSGRCELLLSAAKLEIPCLPLGMGGTPHTIGGTILQNVHTRVLSPGTGSAGFTGPSGTAYDHTLVPLLGPRANINVTHPVSAPCEFDIHITNLEIPCMPLTIRQLDEPYTGDIRVFRTEVQALGIGPSFTGYTGAGGTVYTNFIFPITNPNIDIRLSKDPSSCELSLHIDQFDIPCLPLTMAGNPDPVTGTIDLAISRPNVQLSVRRSTENCEFSLRVGALNIPCLPVTFGVTQSPQGSVRADISRPAAKMYVSRDPSLCEFALRLTEFNIPCMPLSLTGSEKATGVVNLGISRPRAAVNVSKADDDCRFSIQLDEFEIPCLPLTMPGDSQPFTGAIKLNTVLPMAQVKVERDPSDCEFSIHIESLDIPCMPLNLTGDHRNFTGDIALAEQKPRVRIGVDKNPGACQFSINIAHFDIPCMPLAVNNGGLFQGAIDLNDANLLPEVQIQLAKAGGACELNLDALVLNIPRMPHKLNNVGVINGIIDGAVLVPQIEIELVRFEVIGLQANVQNFKVPRQPRALFNPGEFIGNVAATAVPCIDIELARKNVVDLELIVNKLEIPASSGGGVNTQDVLSIISGNITSVLSGNVEQFITGYSGNMSMVSDIRLSGDSLVFDKRIYVVESGIVKSQGAKVTPVVLSFLACT